MRQHAQPISSTSETLPSTLSDFPIALRPSAGIETSLTVNSHSRLTHLFLDHDSDSSRSAFNTADLLNIG